MNNIATSARLGPFVNEDGDIWVPVEVGGIVAARKIAANGALSKFAFSGMEEATMSLHEVYSRCPADEQGSADCEFKDDQPCVWTGRAYHFLETDE